MGVGAAAMIAPGLAKAQARQKPNVLFILADDLGWVDTALYGSRYYETPNIDALAKKGMMFTQAYAAAPLCSATRGSIMTGQWPARVGITGAGCHTGEPRLKAADAARDFPWRRGRGLAERTGAGGDARAPSGVV